MAKKKATTKKKASAKATKAKEKQIKADIDMPKPKAKSKSGGFWRSATPYILILLGIILLICFFTVRLLGMDDGAGIVGGWIDALFCGLFGFSAFFLPALFGYIGVKWILYNLKSKEKDVDPDELKRYRRRTVLQTVMGILLIVLLASLICIFSGEFDSLDIEDMWSAAADDLVGGGVIGGVIGVLMVMAFEAVISSIIIIFVMIIAALFVLGLTPDRIVMYIRDRSIEARAQRLAALEEEKLLEEEERAREAEERREEAKRNRRMAVARIDDEETSEPAPVARAAASMSVDEMMADDEPVQTSIADINAKAEIAEEPTPVGEDFGGDPVFDESEFSDISGVLDNLVSEEEPSKKDTEDDDLDIALISEEELQSDMAAVALDDEDTGETAEVDLPYVFPTVDMLDKNKNPQQADFTAELQENARILRETLKSFKVNIKDITYSRGPTITRYELKPEAGTRVRAIANLVDDIALNLATSGVRIEAPIPNKPAVGIEVPNRDRATVYLRDLIESPKFTESKSKLTASLGMDVGGNPIYFDIAKMPHLLIAGATGMGKSVCINTIIVSLLYKAKPDELKLILVDPKKVEFNIYKDIPHLYAPIVSDPKKAAGALASAVAEMERRFELIEEAGVRDIGTYNAVTADDPTKEFMPQMVIIIDELADLMMTAPDEVEASICRLAQKARAAGIHIIIGTQRPSVDVITGLIKANIPSRIACTVASQIDSRTILDMAGAEKLIGRGDMLFAPVGSSKPMRVQGAFVSEAEVEKIVSFIRDNNYKARYNSDFITRIEEEAAKCGIKKGGGSGSSFDGVEGGADDGVDAKFDAAVRLAIEEQKISTSLMQRRLGVGYGRAAKIIDEMEERGYVSKADGNKPRKILVTMDQYLQMLSGE